MGYSIPVWEKDIRNPGSCLVVIYAPSVDLLLFSNLGVSNDSCNRQLHLVLFCASHNGLWCRKSSRINTTLAVNGLTPLLISRLDHPDAIARLNLLKLIKVCDFYMPYCAISWKMKCLDTIRNLCYVIFLLGAVGEFMKTKNCECSIRQNCDITM